MSVYGDASAKQQRAQEHINELQRIIDVWRKFDQNAFGIKVNPHTGDVTYYLKRVPALPESVALIVGDILHNLRSALDYMACGMVVAGGGKITSKTKFPVREVAEDWEKSGLEMVRGAKQEALEALRRIGPYKAGNYFLWLLHRLNNIDKHRLLIPVGAINSGRTLTPNEQAAEPKRGEKAIFVDTPRGRIKVSARPNSQFLLHDGQELLTVTAAEAENQMGFVFDIEIREPPLTEGTPVTFLLALMSSEVSVVLGELQFFV
jgi:hypothetical protein